MQNELRRICFNVGCEAFSKVHVSLHASGTSTLSTSDLEESAKLFFAGSVELAQRNHSFMIGAIKIPYPPQGYGETGEISLPLYVCGEEGNQLASECFVPAWLVRVLDSGEGSPTMAFGRDLFSFDLPDYLKLSDMKQTNIRLRVPNPREQ